MRRVLTTLMILLVVLVAGISALVLLVNPNDFRAYMVQQVEARSGYQLKLDEPLRWHVWPQLSILSGRMSLTAPGASTPLVTAANMRLDVELWPLLSHQLHVKQVMLKGAVIQLTPQSEAASRPDAPVAPGENPLPDVETDKGWSFAISHLQVADSVLVFQHEDEEQVTVRDIRLNMEQNPTYQATVEFSGRINRNQRDLALAMKARVDASDYPHNLSAAIEQFDWQLKGGDLLPQGISGQATLQASWQEPQKRLSFSDMHIAANDSVMSGQGSVVLADKPEWALDLNFDKLNLENLLSAPESLAASGTTVQKGQAQPSLPRPVIARDSDDPAYDSLRGFSAQVALNAKSVRWRGMDFTNVSSQITNQAGLLTLSTLQGTLGKGQISLPGELDVRGNQPKSQFQPKLDNVEIGTILKAFDYPIALTGNLSMAGDFSGDQIDADAFRRSWQGQAHVEMTDTRMEGLNFQQLIQQAIARSSNDVKVQQNYDNATRLDAFNTELALDRGKITLEDMEGQSPLLAVDGKGTLDLIDELCDTRFNVRVVSGWGEGDSKLIEFLKNTPIPLHVYGKWQTLNYNLQVDQVLREHLQSEAKRRLNDWADRNKESKYNKDVKKLLDKL
ncbi:outer membrane assembly protein AsmA [Enterobacter sp.]|uniref:outer membrane assembly protein AsmA n=1 Tax=Enterobacter sp. TaxID=42895 RepID=UPI00296EE92D|nr:outer membrane assembly protein AsmA [Enterobacter sp.]